MPPWCWNVSCDTTWTEPKRLVGIEISLLRQLMAKSPPDAINLALGELGFSFPEILANHARDLLIAPKPAYTANAGLIELRQRIARDYGTGANCVCVCNGAEEALYIAMQALIEPGDIVAIPDPDYPAYPALAGLASAEVIRLPFEPDFCNIEWDIWRCKLKGVKALLMSSPSNPSGYCISREDSVRLAEITRQTGTVLIVDEIYREVYCEQPELPDWNQFDRLIRIGGVSKSHLMSGWRIGWIQAPESFINSAIKLKQYISTCPPWLSQKLALYALDCPEVPEDVRTQMRENHTYLKHAFASHQIHLPQASPYALLKVTDGLKQAEEYLRQGVITVPGIAFGNSTKEYVRINFAVERELLRRALGRIL